MEKLWIVDMQDKSWRVNPHLGTVVYFQLPAGMGWRRMGILGIAQEPVQHGGGDAGQAFLLDAQGQGQHLIHSLSGFCRDEQ